MKRSQAWVVLVLLASNCYYDKSELLYPQNKSDCTALNASFSQGVMPIISQACATSGCHDASAVAGVQLLNYNDVKAHIDRINQRAIVEKTMPPAGPLTSSQINLIKCWISSGSPNN